MWLRFLIRNLGKSRKAGSRLLQSHRIHTPALCERFSKRRFAVFERFTSRKLSRQMQDFENETRGALLRQKAPLPQPAEFYNREARLAAPNRTAVPLPEVHGIFRSRTISVLSLKFPCHPLFEILHLSAGGCRSDESRKPKPYFKYLSWRAGMRRR